MRYQVASVNLTTDALFNEQQYDDLIIALSDYWGRRESQTVGTHTLLFIWKDGAWTQIADVERDEQARIEQTFPDSLS